MNCNYLVTLHQNLLKRSILKTIIRIFILLSLTLHLSAQTPKHEVRAVWLTTIGGFDWPRSSSAWQQKQELTGILDKLKQANINTVLFQTRIRATTVFPMTLEPWDVCMTGKAGASPGYDPLQFCIEECHKRGMECHAWIVTIPVGKWNAQGCKLLRQRYPNLIVKIGEEGYMNPEKAQTGDYLAQFCREVTRRYDVDGIHLDYIRYPETWNMRVSKQQGRQYITDIVRKIYKAVKWEKSWVKVSCSPIGKYDDLSHYRSSGWNAYSTVCQDAQGWLREGVMDEIFPMMYFQGNQFYPFVADWQQHSYGRIVAPGLAIYMLHPSEMNWNLDIIRREMGVLRQQGLGCTFFRSKFLTDNIKGIYTFTKDFNRTPALVPPMTWAQRTPPDAPASLQVNDNMLTWTAGRDHSNGSYLTYNVYASTSSPVNTDDPRNLIATRVMGMALNVQTSTPLHYAVCAVDRYGNESAPIQDTQRSTLYPQPSNLNPPTSSTLLPNDGRTLTVPALPEGLPVEYLVVETMQGVIVAYHNNLPQIDISKLPHGVYTLKTLNSQGITYRLGAFNK